MEGALIILGFLVVVGVILYIFDSRLPSQKEESRLPPRHSEREREEGTSAERGSSAEEGAFGEGSECCGLHLVCEKDSLSPVSGEVEYYDDEELDRFIGRSGNDYSPEEVEEFRDVLMTLRPEDVAGWARSITVRGLELPAEIRDELLMLVNEQRNLRK